MLRAVAPSVVTVGMRLSSLTVSTTVRVVAVSSPQSWQTSSCSPAAPSTSAPSSLFGLASSASLSSSLGGRRPLSSLTLPQLTARSGMSCPRRHASFTKHVGYELVEAIKLMKCFSVPTFDETVELTLVTTVDPRKPNQMLRGVAKLPNGSGKAVRVAVFAKGQLAEDAKAAGADVVGGEDLMEQIQAGTIDFTKCIASPDMMPVVGRVARILGPRGLMPNPKLGSVTMNISKAVRAAKQGQVDYKCERKGVVSVPIGKVSFSDMDLIENINAFVEIILKDKPSGAKGVFLAVCYLSTSQGKGISVSLKQAPFNLKLAQ